MLICILTKIVMTSCSVTMMLFLHVGVKPLMTLTTVLYLSFFFFQAEDGIRDPLVTGVQTCALPIYRGLRSPVPARRLRLRLVARASVFAAALGASARDEWEGRREHRLARPTGRRVRREIGRASCRERG